MTATNCTTMLVDHLKFATAILSSCSWHWVREVKALASGGRATIR